MDCVFCAIINGTIPSKKLYEDDRVVAFYDTQPKAAVHFLVVPKMHITGTDRITADNSSIVGYVYEVIAALTKELDLTNGYRIVNNCGLHAGQTVPHLHFHVLGGEMLDDL